MPKKSYGEIEAENKILREQAAKSNVGSGESTKFILSTREELTVQERIEKSNAIMAKLGIKLPNVGDEYFFAKDGEPVHLFDSKTKEIKQFLKKLQVIGIDDPATMTTAGELRPRMPTINFISNYIDNEKKEVWDDQMSNWSAEEWKNRIESKLIIPCKIEGESK